MLKRIHVYDCDGVLVDSAHRHNYLSNGALDFADYFAKSIPEILARDIVLPLAKQYKKDCDNPEIYAIVCSVRSKEEKHIESIKEKLGLPDLLLLVGETMPPCTPGHILKRRALQRLFNLRQFKTLPRFFWEDSLRNINACRDLFTTCFHVDSEIFNAS